jgi:hypothetical protein
MRFRRFSPCGLGIAPSQVFSLSRIAGLRRAMNASALLLVVRSKIDATRTELEEDRAIA